MSVSVLDALKTFTKPTMIALVGLISFLLGAVIHGTIYSDAAPVQPIEFSHRVHAGDNEIPCMMCHAYADRSPSAGVPSVSKCVGCHRTIAADKPEVQKIFSYWDERQPIPWIKVHDVPDFVHFTHKRHIKAGIECEECHGAIETMDRVERQESLKMPWCVSCHTEREVEHGRDCWTCHK